MEEVTAIKESVDNKNVTYYNKFCYEQDPNKRLELTKDFLLKDAGDLWLYLYSGRGQEITKKTDERETDVEMLSKIVDTEKEKGEENQFIKKLVDYKELRYNQVEFKKAIDNNEIPLGNDVKNLLVTEMTKSADQAWQDFVTALDVEPDQELLSWLKEKADSQNIIVYEKNSNSKDILQAHMAYAKTGHLVINPNLMPSRFTGAMFLMSLAHERGHSFVNEGSFDLESLGETALVYEEFFAMMEEQREYNMAGDKFQGSIKNRELYETPLNFKETIVGNALSNSDIVPNFKPGKVALVLFEAYNHALIQLTQAERIRIVSRMLEENKDMDQIKTELTKFNTPKPSLLPHQEMDWKRKDIP